MGWPVVRDMIEVSFDKGNITELRNDQARRNRFNNVSWNLGIFFVRCLCECQGGGPDEIYRRKSRVTIILDTAASHRQIELAEHSYGEEGLCTAKDLESPDDWQT